MACATSSFPEPVSPQNQDAEVGFGDPGYLGDQPAHGITGSHGFAQRRLVLDLGGQTPELALEGAFVERAENHPEHLVVFERFRQVIVRASPHGRHRAPNFRVACHQNNGEVLVQGFGSFQKLHPVHIGRLQIHNQSVRVFRADHLQGCFSTVGHHGD